jgi:hypothetical protein
LRRRGALKVLTVGRLAPHARPRLRLRLYASGTKREMYSRAGPAVLNSGSRVDRGRRDGACRVANQIIDFALPELRPLAAFAALSRPSQAT